MRILGWTRLNQGEDWSHSLFCLTFLLWTSMSGLADLSSKMHRIYKKQDIYTYNMLGSYFYPQFVPVVGDNTDGTPCPIISLRSSVVHIAS